MVKKELGVKELLSEGDADTRIKELGFENGLQLLGELVERVESGSLPLEKSILSYEKGVLLIEHLRGLLTGAEEN